MSETSFPWSGTTVGDASVASYDHLEFSRVYSKIIASDDAGYVVPGYGSSLNVQASSPAAATIDIAAGAAFVKGFFYENTALNTLAVAANASGNPRIDRVVLRVDFAGQTVRVAILAGTPAAAPSAPALTQSYGTTWEISLAYIWVANGFATITDVVIHDERSMLVTALSFLGTATKLNLVRGSELIPKNAITITTGIMAVAGTWFASGLTAPTVSFVTKPAQQLRGNAVSITAPAGNAITVLQAIAVNPSTVYTLRGLFKSVASGDLTIAIFGQGTAGNLISRTIHIANTFVDETIRFTTGPTDTAIEIRMTVAATKVFHYGQITLVEGYHLGLFLPVRELIMLPQACFDASWNFTAKSTANTDVDLTISAWGALGVFNARDEVQSIMILAGCNDSGSAAAANNVAALGLTGNTGLNGTPGSTPSIINYMDLAGEVNDRRKYMTAVVPAKIGVSNMGFRIVVIASGVGTLDAFVGITGIYT